MNVRFTMLCVLAGLLAGGSWWWFSASPEPQSLVSVGTPASSESNDSLPISTGVVSYNAAVMLAAPSVVSVYASFAPADVMTAATTPLRVRTSQGSGVIVGEDGLVVTNWHLVADADTINVALPDGRLLPATMIGHDLETDIAVLQVPRAGLPALRLDIAPTLVVGDVVLAIGNPFGVGQTVTQGIVSATRRRVAGASPWQNFVQIDAAINPGNSGGALINPAGELVGVTTAVFRRNGNDNELPTLGASMAAAQGIGFAIPANLLAEVIPQIVQHGRVARGWLGVGAADLPMFPRIARKLGTAAGAVITGSSLVEQADGEGLRRGDVVTAVEGKAVVDANALLLTIASYRPDTVVSLSVFRDGEAAEIKATLGERSTDEGATRRE